VWLLAGAVLVVVMRGVRRIVSDWLDPNWRHQLSNAVIAWVVLAVLAAVIAGGYGLVWWNRSPQVEPHIDVLTTRVVKEGDLFDVTILLVNTSRTDAIYGDTEFTLIATLQNWKREERRIGDVRKNLLFEPHRPLVFGTRWPPNVEDLRFVSFRVGVVYSLGEQRFRYVFEGRLEPGRDTLAAVADYRERVQ
jgi:hypothetical protein